MTSSIYKNINQLRNAGIDSIIKALRNDAEESATGKSLILLEYIFHNTGIIDPDRLMMADVLNVLNKGHGWKLKRFFIIANNYLDDDYKRFKHYCAIKLKLVI